MPEITERIEGIMREHQFSRWRSFSNGNEILRCAKCKTDFGKLAGTPRPSDPDPYTLWSNHIAPFVANAVVETLGLKPEYAACIEIDGEVLLLGNDRWLCHGMAASDMWHQAPGSFVGTALVSQWERSNA